MNILPISSNMYRNNSNGIKNNQRATSFKAEMDSMQVKRVVGMLKGKISEVKILSDLSEINDSVTLFTRKQGAKLANNPIGVMVVPKEYLPEVLVGQRGVFDTKNYTGVCIASGDKYGPIEYWNQVNDAILVMLPKSSF